MLNVDVINQIEQFFKAENLIDAIDIESLIPLSLSKAKNDPQLSHFFALDENGPFSEIIQRGVQSLRKGFYKITSKPYFRTNLSYGTFAADVHYCNEVGTLFKYHANIGPLTNTEMLYRSLHQNYADLSHIPIINDFLKDRIKYGSDQYYRVAKEIFYNKIFDKQKILYVHDCAWSPPFPATNRMKKVTWCFIDF